MQVVRIVTIKWYATRSPRRAAGGSAVSLWLSREEIIELTGYKNVQKQKLALGEMSVRFRSRASDGFPMVDRWQFEGEIVKPGSRRKEPNWAAIRESRK
jgi:hypothetical protein